ncbi:hypothetical protein HNP48_001704 [Acidovorax soli]|uniref:Uncharacterized protein n=1 Tax=Acidovorax soli TaxID=592050 RepID=A0A7X0PBW1_9BURK|nr:hypothetical protein [Acidovorax soli]
MTATGQKRKFGCATHHHGAAQRAASKKPCKDRTHHGRCAGWHAHRPAPPKWVCAPSCDTRHRRITAVRQRSVQPYLCMRASPHPPVPACPPVQPNHSFCPDATHATEPLPFGVSSACLLSLEGRASTLPGWDARRGVQPRARLLASAATPQTARPGTGPKGWGEIGRLDAPAACMGSGPRGAPEASTHPDGAAARPRQDRKVSLNCTGPGMASLPVLHRWNLAYPVVCQGCTRQRRAFDVGPPGGRSR